MQPKIDRKSKRILQVVILAIPTNARPNAAEPQNPIARLIHFHEIIIKYKIRALEPQAPAAASRSNILKGKIKPVEGIYSRYIGYTVHILWPKMPLKGLNYDSVASSKIPVIAIS